MRVYTLEPEDRYTMAPPRKRKPTQTQKIAISIRLKPETLAAYRATGRRWQTRISAVLDQHVALSRASLKRGPHA